MLFERIESSGLAQYSYLIGDKTNAVVIDPRRDCDIYIEKATEAGMVITDVLETHRHEDFAVGSVELAARTGAAIWHADNQLPYRYGRPVEAGQNWVVGNLRLEALHTPGHTEGSRSRDTFIHSVARELPKPLYFDRTETINLEGPPLLGNSPVPAPLTPNTFQEMIRDAYVIDVRGTEAFCASHVPGSFAMSLPTIPNSIGWFVPYDRPLLLVMDGASVLNAFPYLVRQGYDSVKGYLSGGMCGWAAGGYHTDSVDLLSPRDLLNQKDDWWILDVRSAGELATGKIPGAHHIWMKHLNGRVDDVPKDQPVVVYCGNGPRSLVAASVIQRSGCKHVGLLNGGIMAWCALRLPLA